MCGLQVFVAQPLTDDGQAGAHVTHRAGPGMAARICRQGCTQSGHRADFLQVVVHLMLHPLVLPPFRAVRLCDDGQKVRAVFRQVGVVVHDVLHGRLPADGQLLPGLLAAVVQLPVSDVVFLQVGKVHERDALQINATNDGLSLTFLSF